VRSLNQKHIESNFDVFDFSLSDTEMKRLDSISDGRRVTWDPNDMR
jgi:diketogulonate reductase-like aldo/keto reductase